MMDSDLAYLKPNVVIEPLFDRWYAWSHLISPATAAMNIVERHLTIIDSFVSDPAIHMQAVRNSQMKGGPFMDIDESRIGEVKQLRDETTIKRERSIKLASAIKELDELLRSDATGYSLESLYKRVPEVLRGFVELFYDRNNKADFRFYEPLLYNSQYYDKSAQSIALWTTNNDHRPFCLSTPRLPANDVINLEIPFDHPVIDALAQMKRIPGSIEKIKNHLHLPKDQETLFQSFFTSTAPPQYQKYTGDRIRMRYFGHACILIETSEQSILIDPLVSYYGYPTGIDHFSDADLPDFIDYVLITHNHQDHVVFETLLPLRHRIGKILVPGRSSGKLEDPNLLEILKRIGFLNAVSIDEMEEVAFDNVKITGLPFTGEHSDLNVMSKLCYLVEISGFKLMFVADSRVVEPAIYKRIHETLGDVDVIFLGMECDGAPLTWLYGPLFTKKITHEQDASRRLSGSDCERGMHLVNIFNPLEVYVYAMGMEPWLEFISSIKYTADSNPIVQSSLLVSSCIQKGVIAERLFGEKEILYDRKIEIML